MNISPLFVYGTTSGHGMSYWDFHLYVKEVSLRTMVHYKLTYETQPIVSFASLASQLLYSWCMSLTKTFKPP